MSRRESEIAADVDILSTLGLDSDELEWQQLALCRTGEIPTTHFYDDYETSPSIARAVDDACLSCPVMAQCLAEGIENSEWGVWGGVYLTSGKPDNNKNNHKTPEIKAAMKERITSAVL